MKNMWSYRSTPSHAFTAYKAILYLYTYKNNTLHKVCIRVVTGLLTGHNTLKRHPHLLGMLAGPLCRKCRVREETSAHILCECEALALLRHAYLGSFFLEPEDIRSLGLGVIWNYSKVAGLS